MTQINIIEKCLNSVIDSLQVKYSDDIEIDVEEFNKIKLTRVDMEVVRQNVPFSRVVPLFPLITTDIKLDYGNNNEKRMIINIFYNQQFIITKL